MSVPTSFSEYWLEAVAADNAIVELLGASPIATGYLPAEVAQALAEAAEGDFYSREYKPPLARAYVVISAASQIEAEFIGTEVASRNGSRVLGELEGFDLRDHVSYAAVARLFSTYADQQGLASQ